MNIEFTLNDQVIAVDANPLQPLLHTLREQLNHKSPKEGCGEGECGACSVILNGELVNACMVATGQAAGATVTTLEGLRNTTKGRCIIDALLEAKGVQCGFCSPGMVLALYVLLEQNSNPTEADVRTALSGNLCRCTGYGMIIDAAKIASKKGAELW